MSIILELERKLMLAIERRQKMKKDSARVDEAILAIKVALAQAKVSADEAQQRKDS